MPSRPVERSSRVVSAVFLVVAGGAAAAGAPGGTAPPPLTLPAAIDQALETNFGLRLARHDLASAQSSVLAEQNAFDFKLTARIQELTDFRRNTTLFVDQPDPLPDLELRRDRRTDEDRLSFTLERAARWGGTFGLTTAIARQTDRFADLDPLHAADATFRYRQPLWGGFGRKVATAGLVSAETGLRERSRSLAEDEMRLVVDVTRAFYQVVRSRAFLRIDQDAVARAAENLRTYQVRLEEGLITSIDVARAESELRQRENTEVQDQEQFRSARDRLAFLLGIAVGSDLDVADSPPQLEPLELDEQAALGEARDQRVDLRNQREDVELAGLSAHVARSATRPRFDLDVAVGATTVVGDEPRAWMKLDQDDTWHAGLDLSYTFGERSDDESLVRALIAEEQARLRLADLERSIELEVRDTMRQIRSLERRVDLLRQGFDLARESLRLAQLQLQEDLIRTTDLLQIQGDVVRAETDYTDAIADHAVARVTLDLVLGRYRTTGQERTSPFLRAEPSVAPDLGSSVAPDLGRMGDMTDAPRRPSTRRRARAAGENVQ